MVVGWCCAFLLGVSPCAIWCRSTLFYSQAIVGQEVAAIIQICIRVDQHSRDESSLCTFGASNDRHVLLFSYVSLKQPRGGSIL